MGPLFVIMNILLVDDELDICILLTGILQRDGHESEYVNDITSAKVKVKKGKYDIIFLDLNLPDGSGYDLITPIKNSKQNTHIIICSAYDEKEEREKASKMGADLFIGKPLSRKKIQTAINQLYSK